MSSSTFLRPVLLPLLWSAVACGAGATAQAQRVFVNGTPSNLLVDWTGIAVAADPLQANAFVAVMPLAALPWFCTFEPDLSMDWAFGAGNWLRCRMEATEWAYLSADACAHLPAAGAAAPQSLLTTDYDYGVYDMFAVGGSPLFAGVTWFGGSPAAFVEGEPGWSFERWQLRTRGFFPGDLWNACPGTAAVTPNFSGYVGARFTYVFQ